MNVVCCAEVSRAVRRHNNPLPPGANIGPLEMGAPSGGEILELKRGDCRVRLRRSRSIHTGRVEHTEAAAYDSLIV